jgi:F-type H+-transporting ATPase subunit a
LGDLFFGGVDIVVSIIEFISEFFRIISLTFRLFGNMIGGEILVFMLLFLLFVTPVIIPYGLEILFGLIQALIFGFLTLVFASIAATSHDHEGGH